MITEDSIKAAIALSGADHQGRVMRLGPDWISNGHFAVRGDLARLAEEDASDRVGAIAKWLAMPREPATEDARLRIDSVSTSIECGDCDGGKVRHDDCSDCDGHRCDDCGGTGKEIGAVVGQMVFSSAAGLTVVDPAYGHLLDGLTVMRAGTDSAARSMLLGLDADGTLVVAVMPRLAAVRR